ncbi:MAG: NADP-binding protein [Spirochaetaceae bacterium 4572_59]|nr:MAG: NADP-binding protein [Spirochaetaceae bacterium 4572_59]
MENIKVIIWGFGAMGSGIAGMLLKKKGVEITGVCDNHPDRVGKSMYQLCGVEQMTRPDITVKADIEAVLQDISADIALLATDSFTAKAFPKIQFLLEHKLNVISTAEEMAYPKASEPELAEKLNKIALKNGVSLLGTGINPGLIMDLLVIALSGACMDVESIEAERINSLSPFGPAVMEEQGVGLTPAEFAKGVKNGTLAGHVGFNESVGMITDAIGWKLSEPVRQSMEPIISSVYRKTKYVEVQAGNIAGCRMKGSAFVHGEEKVRMIHPQQVEPQLEGCETGDYIRIKGCPDISMAIQPEIPGGIGTIAMCVNMIPHVINARPGLKTMIDLPVPRAIMGDMRDLIYKF